MKFTRTDHWELHLDMGWRTEPNGSLTAHKTLSIQGSGKEDAIAWVKVLRDAADRLTREFEDLGPRACTGTGSASEDKPTGTPGQVGAVTESELRDLALEQERKRAAKRERFVRVHVWERDYGPGGKGGASHREGEWFASACGVTATGRTPGEALRNWHEANSVGEFFLVDTTMEGMKDLLT